MSGLRRLFVLAALAVLAACATVPQGGASVAEVRVAIAMPNGTADALLFHRAGGGRWPAVLLWTDTAGLRPAYAEIGRKLATEGYVVLIPNAYYRTVKLDGSAAAPPLPADEARERGAQWRAAATEEAVFADSRAYFAFLDARPQTDTRRSAGTLGFDYGSINAFHAARALPDRIAAVAAIYPAGTATPRPNSPHLFVNQSKAAYYVVVGKNDDIREPGDKDDYTKAFAAAGLDGTVEVSPANHGFALPEDPAYDAAASDAAWSRTLDLFRTALAR